MTEFPALEKYLKMEPSFKSIKDDDYKNDIMTHWIFTSYDMTIEQKKLKNIDPNSKLYDAVSDNIDKIIDDIFINQNG